MPWYHTACRVWTLMELLQCQADLREENSFSRSGLATHAFSRLEPREPGKEMRSGCISEASQRVRWLHWVPLPPEVQAQRSYSLCTSSSASITATW